MLLEKSSFKACFEVFDPLRASQYTIIRPMLQYAVIIWDRYTQTNIAKTREH